MTEEQIEKVAAAIESVQLFSRFNDWTSDRVPGLPIEICRYGDDEKDEDEIVVVQRYPADANETTAWENCIRRERAIAAIIALSGEPTP